MHWQTGVHIVTRKLLWKRLLFVLGVFLLFVLHVFLSLIILWSEHNEISDKFVYLLTFLNILLSFSQSHLSCDSMQYTKYKYVTMSISHLGLFVYLFFWMLFVFSPFLQLSVVLYCQLTKEGECRPLGCALWGGFTRRFEAGCVCVHKLHISFGVVCVNNYYSGLSSRGWVTCQEAFSVFMILFRPSRRVHRT